MAHPYTRSPEQKKRDIASKRQWYLRNRTRLLAEQRNNPERKAYMAKYNPEYQRINKEKLAKQKKAYYLANKERIAKYKKVHGENNRSKINAYHRAWERDWYASDPARALLKVHKRRAKTKLDIDKTQIENWESRICGICNKLIENKFHIDHKTPLAKGGLHVVENLQLAHPTCNLKKGDKLDYYIK